MPSPRRLFTALRALGPAGLGYLERLVVEASRRREVTYTRDNGRTEVIRVLSVPSVIARADAAYLHRVCRLLAEAFRKTIAARRDVAEVREVLPLVPGEQEWL